MTLPPDQLGVTAPSSDPDDTLEEDAPPFFVDADLQALRTPLRERINAYPHPSRLINQIGLADARCRESTRALTRLIGRSPRILKVIRASCRLLAHKCKGPRWAWVSVARCGGMTVLRISTRRR